MLKNNKKWIIKTRLKMRMKFRGIITNSLLESAMITIRAIRLLSQHCFWCTFVYSYTLISHINFTRNQMKKRLRMTLLILPVLPEKDQIRNQKRIWLNQQKIKRSLIFYQKVTQWKTYWISTTRLKVLIKIGTSTKSYMNSIGSGAMSRTYSNMDQQMFSLSTI